MQNVLKPQLDTVQQILDVAQKEIATLEKYLKTDFAKLSVADQEIFMVNDISHLYLINFWSEFEFLYKRITIEKTEDIHYFLANLRNLIETYAELLYFLNQDARTKLGIFVSNYLLHLSDHYRFVAPVDEIKSEYDRYSQLVKAVLEQHKITFPEIEKLSYRSIQNQKFNFPKYDQIFMQPYFKELSSESLALWKNDSAATFYNKYYRIFSAYTHRSFTNQRKSFTGNEIFWSIQFLFIIGLMMVELSNKKIFNGEYKGELEALTQKIAEVYPAFLSAWNSQRSATQQAN